MTQTRSTEETTVDLDAVRTRYRLERDKRLRPDGLGQYVFTNSGEFESFSRDPWSDAPATRETVHDDVDVTIVGTGFGGLVAGAYLRKAGLEKIRFADPAGDVGGTWYWNRYPGIACDVESLIYLPLLEEVDVLPTRKYASGEEIRQHAIALAKKFELYRDALFHTAVDSAEWNDETERWTVKTDRGDEFVSRYVILSAGLLLGPKLPIVPGIENYKGHMFHTSRWDQEYTGSDGSGGAPKLADKRVAVVGTGATGVQLVPAIAPDVKELFVVQRTPSAIDTRDDEPLDAEFWKAQPAGWQGQRRDNFIQIVHGTGAAENLVGDKWTDIAPARGMRQLAANGFSGDPALTIELADYEKMEELRARVAEIVEDSDTAAKLQPWYRHMCKRPAFSDKYLQSFNRENVTLVDSDGQGIERFTEDGIVVLGVEYKVDVVIFATGYEQNSNPATRANVNIVGREGTTLSEYWSDGLRTVHGWVSRGFPNLFHIGFTQNAHSVNFSHILEEQGKHISSAVAQAEKLGGVLVEPTEDAEDAWVQEIVERRVDASEFSAECTPGYYNAEGKPRKVSQHFGGGPIEFHEILARWRESDRYSEVLRPSNRS